MQVSVNGKTLELIQSENIFGLLRLVDITSPSGIAVAVNNTVIAKKDWEIYIIQENDQVTLIRATQGG